MLQVRLRPVFVRPERGLAIVLPVAAAAAAATAAPAAPAIAFAFAGLAAFLTRLRRAEAFFFR